MGIHFRCHHCEHELHVKDFQAGKRGRCPECKGKFRIPPTDAPHSLDPDAPLDDSLAKTENRKSDSVAASATRPAQTALVPTEEKLEKPKLEPQTQAVETIVQPPKQEPPLPRALQTAADSVWYVRPPSGGQFGPAPSSTMWQWLGENRVGRDALVWCEGWPEWLIAENVFDDHFLATAVTGLSQRPAPSATTDATPVLREPGGHMSQEAKGSSPEGASLTSDTTTHVSQEPSLSERNRAGRKQKRRRNYTFMIAVLTVVMLLLVGALVVVLFSQQT